MDPPINQSFWLFGPIGPFKIQERIQDKFRNQKSNLMTGECTRSLEVG